MINGRDWDVLLRHVCVHYYCDDEENSFSSFRKMLTQQKEGCSSDGGESRRATQLPACRNSGG